MPSPAPALDTLKDQLLVAYPAMGAANLGIMGDGHHTSASDHYLGNAIDIPVAGGPGAGAPMIALLLVLLTDRRAHYGIYDRGFYHAGRAPAVYYGASPHTDHIHLSIDPLKREDAREWDIGQEADVKEIIIPRGPAPGYNRVYALIDPKTNDYCYGSVSEDMNRVANAGYSFDGEAFDLALDDPTCTMPLHRLTRNGFHKCAIEPVVEAMTAAGWTDEGPLGRVSGSSGDPVYEWVKGECQYLTVNPDAQGTADWTLVGKPFRCGAAPAPAPDPHPYDANERIAALTQANTALTRALAAADDRFADVATAKARFDADYDAAAS